MNNLHILLLVAVILVAGCAGGCPDTKDPVCGEDGKTYDNPCLAGEANVSVSYKGPCKAPACDDSDGGKDIFTAGGVMADGEMMDDTCKDGLAVTEYYCEDGAALSKELPCPAGYSCKDGKCSVSPCDDSDGGIKPLSKGVTTVGTEEKTDVCEEDGSLKEFFCEGGAISYNNVDCPSDRHCVDGACVEYTCTDSDGGQDKFIKGNTSKGDDSFSDSCPDETKVTEYYCDANRIKSRDIACGSEYECSEGECIEKIGCVDSDNGKDKYTRGTVTVEDNEYVDDCFSDAFVLEYYCDDDEMASEKLACGIGHECSSGKCVIAQCQKDEDPFDEIDLRHQIATFGSSKTLRLYEDDIVELEDELILEVVSVSASEANLRLYNDYDDYKDNDDICSEAIEEGNTTTDMCNEDTGDIEVYAVNVSGDYAELILDEFRVVQMYSENGILTEWIGYGCPDDKKVYAELDLYFLPYLDTDSDGLDLDNRYIKLFGKNAKIEDIDPNSILFELEGNDFNLEDDDDFDFDDSDYTIDLYFNDGGLYRMHIELS